jgi:hypothetical protein
MACHAKGYYSAVIKFNDMLDKLIIFSFWGGVVF